MEGEFEDIDVEQLIVDVPPKATLKLSRLRRAAAAEPPCLTLTLGQVSFGKSFAATAFLCRHCLCCIYC